MVDPSLLVLVSVIGFLGPILSVIILWLIFCTLFAYAERDDG